LRETTSPDPEATWVGRGTPVTVDELLAQARAKLPHRPSSAEALHAQANGALLVDIRGDDQRRDGLIPGAIVVPRNCLEWRCDPDDLSSFGAMQCGWVPVSAVPAVPHVIRDDVPVPAAGFDVTTRGSSVQVATGDWRT
jgi:rhodanese-related sulfurtransferase